MAFNVCNSKGEHLGITLRPYASDKPFYLIALTALKMEQLVVDFDAMESEIAFYYESKSLLGKVNSEKLQAKLSDAFSEYTGLDYESLVKLGAINRLISPSLYINNIPKENDIFGYILLDTSKIVIKDKHVILDIEANKTSAIDSGAPLFARIVDYPRIKSNILTSGLIEVGQLMSTALVIESGNALINVEFDIRMDVRKGMDIQLFFENKEPRKIFCDGVIYCF